MVKAIPNYFGFDAAEHLQELSTSEINTIVKIYRENNQYTNRGIHLVDIAVVRTYIDEYAEADNLVSKENREIEGTDINFKK